MYFVNRLISTTLQTLFCALLIGQTTIVLADEVDDLLNTAQKNGNLRLSKTNQEVRTKLNTANTSYSESLEKNQSLQDSLMSGHNAIISRQNELAVLKIEAKQQAAYNQVMMASSNQTLSQPVYVSAGSGSLQVAGSSASMSASNSNGSNGSSAAQKPTVSAPAARASDNISHIVVNRGYISSTIPNAYYVDIKNTGNVKESCIVNFYYQYPDGVNGLQSDRSALSTGLLTVGQQGRVTLQLSNRNVLVKEYRISCTKWSFA